MKLVSEDGILDGIGEECKNKPNEINGVNDLLIIEWE